jgi:hypothetical protein
MVEGQFDHGAQAVPSLSGNQQETNSFLSAGRKQEFYLNLNGISNLTQKSYFFKERIGLKGALTYNHAEMRRPDLFYQW